MLIVHRCRNCGHPDVWGERKPHPVLGTKGLPAGCGQPDACPATKCDWNPQPEPMTCYHSDGTPIAEALAASDVIAPGTTIRGYTAGTTCDCEACRALYAQLTATTERTPAP
jgi:hypothetical protein